MSTNPSVITREAGTSKPVSRPGRKRPSLSHILIGLAVILAFGLNYLALQDRQATLLVAIAPQGLREGARFDPGSIELTEVPADLAGVNGFLSEAEADTFDGWIVARDVPAGTLVDESALIAPASQRGERLISIPVSAEHAVGASVVVGDHVDVVTVLDGVAMFVATDLPVVEVAAGEQGALSGGGYFVVVEAGPDDILGIAGAIDSGSIEIVRSTGAEPIGDEG